MQLGSSARLSANRKMAHSTCRCDNNPKCDLLFGGICIERLKVVRSLRLVDTEQSVGPRFGGSRHESE
jgi:hypothetical protein